MGRLETRARRGRSASCRIDDGEYCAEGAWTARGIGQMPPDLGLVPGDVEQLTLRLDGVDAFDTVGAYVVNRARQLFAERGIELDVTSGDRAHTQLMELVAKQSFSHDDLQPPRAPGFLEEIGRDATDFVNNYLTFLAFIGRLTASALRIMFTPAALRWRTVLRGIEEAGFDALPIVGLLTFLLGIVIAYQGGVVMQQYGAGIFIADLVGLSMLRELAPLITAIIVAGRTGSAYTAQIATMKVTEEVDALRTMGVAPLEALALPKFMALVIALPLLTVFADIMGLLGGMIMASSLLDISFAMFFDRLTQSVSVQSLLIGIGKTPVFAVIIAAVGCYQGFEAKHGADEVGRHTTISVVHSIFLVIVVDAIFSIAFSKIGI